MGSWSVRRNFGTVMAAMPEAQQARNLLMFRAVSLGRFNKTLGGDFESGGIRRAGFQPCTPLKRRVGNPRSLLLRREMRGGRAEEF